MALRNAKRLRWEPKGLTDSLDGNATFPGSMQSLQNLIPDPTSDLAWICRPASISKTTFGSFTTPTFISGLLVVGDIAYGMIATGRNAGKDEPFAYNIQTNTFLTVAGILNANTPTSPATTGDWTPPILCQVGQRIIVTHPGFAGGAFKFGWFDISSFSSNTITGSTHSNTTLDTFSTNPLQAGWQPGMTITGTGIPANTTIVSVAFDGSTVTISNAATATAGGITFTVAGGTPTAPLWGAGDTNINNLPSVPLGVAQMNGRAYFACGVNGIPFSDALLPCNRTNANQALTTNDGLAVTAIGPLGLRTIYGGIVQALIAFQSNTKMQQIQGDSAFGNLSMNALPIATGTLAPLSITQTNIGTMFVSPEGMRLIDYNGNVSDPIGDGGKGITLAAIYAVSPSRICSASNADTVRISAQNGSAAGSPNQEYWYDLTRKIWTGPHTFPASLIQLWRGTFLMSAIGVNNTLWQSDAVQSSTSTFIENGTQMQVEFQTSLLPDSQEMEMTSVVETSVMMSVSSTTVVATAIDDAGNILNQVSFPAVVGATNWDSATWDISNWDAFGVFYRQRQVAWDQPLVFKQCSIQFHTDSAGGFRIGAVSLRYQKLGYQLEYA